MKKKVFLLSSLCLILIVAIFAWFSFKTNHTYTLSPDAYNQPMGTQINPIFGKVSVYSEYDTNLVFTDVDTKETFEIGYLTRGLNETIILRRNHFYTIEANGPITISIVNLRIP